MSAPAATLHAAVLAIRQTLVVLHSPPQWPFWPGLRRRSCHLPGRLLPADVPEFSHHGYFAVAWLGAGSGQVKPPRMGRGGRAVVMTWLATRASGVYQRRI